MLSIRRTSPNFDNWHSSTTLSIESTVRILLRKRFLFRERVWITRCSRLLFTVHYCTRQFSKLILTILEVTNHHRQPRSVRSSMIDFSQLAHLAVSPRLPRIPAPFGSRSISAAEPRTDLISLSHLTSSTSPCKLRFKLSASSPNLNFLEQFRLTFQPSLFHGVRSSPCNS